MKPKLSRLMSAALAIPAVGVYEAQAQNAPSESEVKLVYFDYQDWQGSDEDRMHVLTPMVYGRIALPEGWQIEGTAQLDHMTGASPQYLDALSGASGLGIKDNRRWSDIRATKFFERFSVGAGFAYSGENDYHSHSGSLEGRWWTEDKNTTIALGFSPSWDRVGSSNFAELDENRRSLNFFAGVTQVLTPNSIMQSNLMFENGQGYFTDDYKFFDNRPRTRDQYAWLTRYNYYVEPVDGSLHADYRLFHDSWNIWSHTLELKWYQPIGEHLMLRPNIRYYSQSRADFYSGEYPPPDSEFPLLYSADQRLGDFGSLSYGLKVEYSIGAHLSLEALVEFIEQRGSWKLGGGGSNDNLADFHARFTGVGLSGKF